MQTVIRRVRPSVGIGIAMGVSAAGFLAYFATSLEGSYWVDGLNRVLVGAPWFMRFLFWTDKWAGWQWFIVDLIWFWGGLAFAIAVGWHGVRKEDETTRAPIAVAVPTSKRLPPLLALLVASCVAYGTFQGIAHIVHAARRNGYGVQPQLVSVRTLAKYCEFVVTRADPLKPVSVTYDLSALRDDLVAQFNVALVARSTEATFGKALPTTDTVAGELARLHMIGAWREGMQLHFADELSTATLQRGPHQSGAIRLRS